MLRVKPPWSASVRLLDERDRAAVLAICDRDPVANVFVSSRIRALGLEPGRLGAQMWGHLAGGRLESLCYSGANLVPVAASPDAVVAFADRALRQGRRCSSVVGAATEVQALWGLLRPHWGPAREVRPVQPLHFTRGYIWIPLFLLGAPLLVEALETGVRTQTRRMWTVALILFVFLLDNTAWIGTRMAAAIFSGAHGEEISLDPHERKLLAELSSAELKGHLLISQDEKSGYLATV